MYPMVAVTTEAHDTPSEPETQRNQYTRIPTAGGTGPWNALKAGIAR